MLVKMLTTIHATIHYTLMHTPTHASIRIRAHACAMTESSKLTNIQAYTIIHATGIDDAFTQTYIFAGTLSISIEIR